MATVQKCAETNNIISTEHPNEYNDKQQKIMRNHRVKEYEELSLIQPQHFALIFETLPLWLLALNNNSICRLYIPGCTSLSNFTLHTKKNQLDHNLYHNIILNIGIDNTLFSTPPSEIIFLVYGTILFLNEQRLRLRQRKVISIIDHHVLYRNKRPISSKDFSRLTHVEVGRATTMSCIIFIPQLYYFPSLPLF